MTTIKIPQVGGGDADFKAEDLTWMREAFASHEMQNAVRIFGGRDPFFGIRPLSAIKTLFSQVGIQLVAFSPPAGNEEMVVNKANVRDLECPNRSDAGDHDGSMTILKFLNGQRLAVRQTPAEASQLTGKPAPAAPCPPPPNPPRDH